MYLKYIQIVNYKNLRKTRFEFGKGANTVIGENDSGKSNAMTAMRILLDDDYFYTPSYQLLETPIGLFKQDSYYGESVRKQSGKRRAK